MDLIRSKIEFFSSIIVKNLLNTSFSDLERIHGGTMKKFLQASKWIVLTLATFSMSSLSAWYDPTGYWGQRCPNRYDFPARGLYTVRAELLYLRPHVDNLKINRGAIESAPSFSGIPGLLFQFTNNKRERRFKWKHGWKVGVGFACDDCWEADLNWTHYQSRAELSDFRKAKTHWKVHLDAIDLEIGKEMWFRNCIRLKPYLGLRFAQIKQRYKFDIKGNTITFFNPGVLSKFELFGNLRHNYLGGGPRIGFDLSWCVGCGFNFYVTAAANYLWGEMQNRYGDNFIVKKDDKDHHWEGIGITDLSCGIGWSDLWYNERNRLTFRFGYEHHFFIHENSFDSEGGIARRDHKNWFVHGIGGTIILDF